MTRKRYDSHSTEFGLWLREQTQLDSSLGYVATNIDYMWHNYKTNEWMLVEEKRYRGSLTRTQKEMFAKLDKTCRNDPNYQGFFLLVFENTSPEDGRMWLNRQLITRDELIKFLMLPGSPEKEKA